MTKIWLLSGLGKRQPMFKFDVQTDDVGCNWFIVLPVTNDREFVLPTSRNF